MLWGYRELLKDKKPIWCPGCGLYVIMHELARALYDLGFGHRNCVGVFDIGDNGRMAYYLNLDCVHTLHGRSVAVAEGIKTANPDMLVFVVLGDGALGIGANHIVGTARRGVNLVILCSNNHIFGMTGGQSSPTTSLGERTTTHSKMDYHPLDPAKLVQFAPQYYYANTATAEREHLGKCLREALRYKHGIAFVNIHNPCVNHGRRVGKSLSMMNQELRKLIAPKYRINHFE
jgi:2-oxoglutarate ferredoxin oxidoreductase subunit beta